MKKTKKLAVLAAAALGACVCATAVGCGETENPDGHAHEYAGWVITTAPTDTTGGVITGTCAVDGETNAVDVPALSDTDFWTAAPTSPTHTAAGYTIYTSSEYGVSIRVDGAAAIGHDWNDWAFKDGVEPNKTTGATIVRTCKSNDGGVEEVPVPALNNADHPDFWTAGDPVAPGHTTVGTQDFTNATYNLTVTVETPATGHDWNDWTFKDGVKPDMNTGAIIVRTCKSNDGGVEEVPVPALNNADHPDFWTAGDPVAPGHTTVGTQTFTNADYKLSVTVETPATGHNWSAWSFVTGHEPDLTAPGKITRTCADDGAEETVDVLALSDTSYWNKTDIAPDYNTAGYSVYTPKNTNIVIEKRIKTADKLVAPYDNKKYVSFDYTYRDRSVGKVSRYNHWTYKNNPDNLSEHLYLDSLFVINPVAGDTAAACFSDSGQLYRGHVTVEMVDYASGKIKLVCRKADFPSTGDPTISSNDVVGEIKGFVDKDTGIIVFVESEKVSVFVPMELADDITTSSTMNAVDAIESACSVWNGGIAISLKTSADGVNKNIFIDDNNAYFGVNFKNAPKEGSDIAVGSFFDDKDENDNYNLLINYVMITDANGDKITAFGKKNGVLTVTDGVEGTYTGTINTYATQGEWDYNSQSPITIENATAVLDGVGGIHVEFTEGESDNGHYVILSDGKLGIYIGGGYFETTSVTEDTFVCAMELVTLTLHDWPQSDADTPIDQKVVSVCKNIAVPIAISDLSHGIIGTYFDAGYTQLVPNNFIPTENIDVYCRWSDKYIEFTVGDDTHRVYFADGMTVEDLIPSNIDVIDYTNNRYIKGWFTAANGGEEVSKTNAVTASDSGTTLYAHWADIPAYAGEYGGKQLLSGTSTTYSATITISVYGDIEGSIFTGSNSEKAVIGKVNSYVDGVITYTASNGNTGFMWYNDGMLVIPHDLSNNQIDTYPFVLSLKNGANIVDNKSLGINTNKTYLVSLSGNAFALIYNDTVYNNVNVANAFGEQFNALGDVMNSKTIVVTKGNTTVLAVGTTAEKYSDIKDIDGNAAVIKTLDGLQGKYTYNEVEYALDGLGNISWQGSEWAVYAATETDGHYDVYERVRKRAVAPSSGSGDISDDDWENWGDGEWGSGSYDDDDEETVNYVYSYSNKAYYSMTLSGGAITEFDKTMITVTFAIGDDYTSVGTNETSSKSYNKNIPAALVKPGPSSTHMFAGWYTDPECTVPVALVDGKFTPTAAIPLYSKWVEKSGVVSVYYVVDGEQPVYDRDISLTISDELDLSDSTKPGYVMVGVYSNAACTDEFTETHITQDVDVYIKWRVKQAYENSYKVAYFSSWGNVYNLANYEMNVTNSGNQSIVLTDTSATDIVYLPFSGHTSKTSLEDNYGYHKYEIETSFNSTTNIITFNIAHTTGRPSVSQTTANSTFYGLFDPDTKIILAYYTKDTTDLSSGIGLLVPTNYTIGSSSSITGWGGSTVKQLVYDYTDDAGVTHTIYVRLAKNGDEQLVLTDCTIRDEAGNPVTAKAAKDKKYIEIFNNKDSLADPIKLVYKNTNFVVAGPENGTYTCAGKADIFLNGAGDVTWGTKSGTYEAVSGQTNQYLLKITSDSSVTGFKGERYILTVSGSAYTVAEDKVTVTFVSEHGTAPESVSVWRGLSYTLPTEELTASGYKFRYWYTTSASTKVTTVTPTDNSIVVTAKWDPQVTVTYHYLDGTHPDVTDNEVLYAGDTIRDVNAVDFEYDGKAFAGWFDKNGSSDNDWGNEILAGATISTNIDLYAKWVTPSVMMGTYKVVKVIYNGFSGNYNSTEVVVAPTGVVTKGSSEHINKDYIVTEPNSDGTMQVKNGNNTYFAYYEATTGAFAFNKSNNSTELGTAPYVVIKVDSKDISVTTTGKWAATGDRKTRLFTVNVGGETKYILIYNNKLYYDVTVAIKDGGGADTTDLDALKQLGSEVVVTLPDNSTLRFCGNAAESSYAIFAEPDNTYGAYTLGTDKVYLSGVGSLRKDGASYKLTKVGEAASTTYSINTGTEYLEYTFDFTNKTYTVDMPTVNLSFVTNNGTLTMASASPNKNIGISLPTLVGTDYLLLGWYFDAAHTEPVTLIDGKFVPTENKTLYADCSTFGDYTLKTEAGNEYTFVYSDGWWESNNQGKSSAHARLCITAQGGALVVEVVYYSDGEPKFDYLQTTSTGNVTGEMINAKGSPNQKTAPKTARFVLEDGATLTFDYLKDGSGDTNPDTAGLQLTINGVVVTALKTE